MSALDRPVAVTPRPVDVCRALLDALDATEGRRRRRKRNTRADAIGIGMKRHLLERALRDDPDPEEFEGWLLERCFENGPGEGAWRAMALDIFQEWRMAEAAPSFRAWLEAGAPSDDKPGPARDGLPVLALLLGLALAACGGGIDPDAEDVPAIDVVDLTLEERQRAGMRAAVLDPLRAAGTQDSTIYDPPVDLARPADAERWPPPTGTHGDEAVGATVPVPDSGDGGEGSEGGS